MANLMVNGLRAGYSTMQAMEAVSKELPAPISDEFRRVVQEMQLGVNMQTALDNLLRRIPSDDLDLVVTSINVQREVGGNLAEILDTISYTIRERVRIKGEIRVLTTQVMYSGRFLSLLPLIVMGVLYLLNREYMMEFSTRKQQRFWRRAMRLYFPGRRRSAHHPGLLCHEQVGRDRSLIRIVKEVAMIVIIVIGAAVDHWRGHPGDDWHA